MAITSRQAGFGGTQNAIKQHQAPHDAIIWGEVGVVSYPFEVFLKAGNREVFHPLPLGQRLRAV